MIGLAVGGGAAVLLTFLAFAWWHAVQLRNIKQSETTALVEATDLRGKLAVATSDIATQKARADYQQERADALDQELDMVADSGDPAAARGRVLSRLTRTEQARATEPASRDAAGTVPASGSDPAVAREGRDALINPWPGSGDDPVATDR